MYFVIFFIMSFLGQALAEESPQDAGFKKELLTVEENVNSLKERVFQSKATLKMLKEIIVQGTVSGSHATIWHANDLSNSYSIESVSYFLDGKGQYAKSDSSGALNSQKEFKVFDNEITPGSHTLSINMRLRGNGHGIFKYVNNYTFEVQSSTVFAAEEGQDCQVRVLINERSGLSSSFFERPQISFEPRCRQMSDVK